MSVSKQVQAKIGKIEPGIIFGLNYFSEIPKTQAVVAELFRLSRKGVIGRLSKGKYFVPKETRFGRLQPSEWIILDNLVKENGGYFGGTTALNRLGVTTQIPSQVTIRGARSTRRLKIGSLTVNLVRSGNPAAEYQQADLTDLIESLRLIKRTPDGEIGRTIARVSAILRGLGKESIENLISLLGNERPYVRALMGAIMEKEGVAGADALKETLNPLTKYKLNIGIDLLPAKKDWNIL